MYVVHGKLPEYLGNKKTGAIMIRTHTRYDFHTHSKYSDGSESPQSLIWQAKQQGLDVLALTDHDTIDGLREAQKEATLLNIDFINGIELSTRYDQHRLIHILGLGIDLDQSDFMTKYKVFRRHREQALSFVVSELQKMGIALRIADLEIYRTGNYLDRQTVAKWLHANNYASSIPRAWVQILDGIDYMPEEIIDVQGAFDMIHAGHGKAFIAHIHKPIGLKGFSDDDKLFRLEKLKQQGLDGIEAFYPTYSDEDRRFIQRCVTTFNLMQSGGSDFHGSNRPEISLGQLSTKTTL